MFFKKLEKMQGKISRPNIVCYALKSWASREKPSFQTIIIVLTPPVEPSKYCLRKPCLIVIA